MLVAWRVVGPVPVSKAILFCGLEEAIVILSLIPGERLLVEKAAAIRRVCLL